MRPLVATLDRTADVGRLLLQLRRTFGLEPPAVKVATVGAFREPHDGHSLLAAWVRDEDVTRVREVLAAAGATFHDQPVDATGWRPAALTGQADPDGSMGPR